MICRSVSSRILMISVYFVASDRGIARIFCLYFSLLFSKSVNFTLYFLGIGILLCKMILYQMLDLRDRKEMFLNRSV